MEGYLGMIYGKKLITNPLLVEKRLKRMCRSKRKRIIKKWLKNPKNYITGPERRIYRSGDSIICHPDVANMLIKACKVESERHIKSINLF